MHEYLEEQRQGGDEGGQAAVGGQACKLSIRNEAPIESYPGEGMRVRERSSSVGSCFMTRG